MHTTTPLNRRQRPPFAQAIRHAVALAAGLALLAPFAQAQTQAQTQTPTPTQERRPGEAAQAAQAERAQAQHEARQIKERAAAQLEAQRPPPWSQAERRFLQGALARSRFSAEAGRIGMERATDPAVKNLAQKLAAHHDALQGQLQELAQSRGFPLDAAPSGDPHKPLQRLRTAGGDFDTVFVRTAGVQAQQQAVRLYEKAFADSRDPLLREWIDTQLQALREPLSEAQRIPLRHAPDKTPNSGRNHPTTPPRGP